MFGYTRTLGDVTLLVLINMSRDLLEYELPGGLAIAGTLLTNVPGDAAAGRFDHRHPVRVAGDDLHGRPGMTIEPPRNPRRTR